MCPAGTFTDSFALKNASECDLCPPTKSCVWGTGGADKPPQPCAKGHYCPRGTKYDSEFPCPAGTYSPYLNLENATQCLTCPRGKYCLEGASVPSGDCPPAHYCLDGTPLPTHTPCPAGTFSNVTGAERVDQCQPCPLGRFCPIASPVPIACPAGSFADVLRSESAGPGVFPACKVCSAGHFCASPGLSAETPCGPGRYSAAGARSCEICRAGHYCDGSTTSETTMLVNRCDAGLWCPPGVSVVPNTVTHACPVASYCPEASEQVLPCPAGRYNTNTGLGARDDCSLCPAGYACFENSTSHLTLPCAPGHYCEPGSVSPTAVPCPAATYRTLPSARSVNDCALCSSGGYCPIASLEPVVCDRGSYCVTGVDRPEYCPLGTYGNSSGLRSPDECTPCPAGWFCDGLGQPHPRQQCDPGYFCEQGSYTPAPPSAKCWAGHYCPLGTSLPIPCPVGTFNPLTGSRSVLACVACSRGYYCETQGLAQVTGPCIPGYYCDGGAALPTQHINPVGTYTGYGAPAPENCSPGSFQPSVRSSSCLPCSLGHYCNNPRTVVPTVCTPGSFCPSGSVLPIPCPPGSYGWAEGLRAESECTPCDPGMFCLFPGRTNVTGECDARHYCMSGATIPNPTSTSFGGLCTVGGYCPKGTALPIPCPLGHFCPASSSLPLECLAGEYNDALGQAQCKACPAGYLCPRRTEFYINHPCPPGHFCTAGSVVPSLCPVGTYSNLEALAQSSECLACPPGSYCDTPGQTVPTGLCSPGYYCTAGSSHPRPTPTTAGNGDLCDVGFYCPKGSVTQVKCPAGSFCGSPGLGYPSGLCTGGYYCLQGSSVASPTDGIMGNECPVAHYCPPGATHPTPCPAGTVSTTVRSASRELCTACDGGHYCPLPAATTVGGLCDAGFYCPPGQVVPNPPLYICPSGHHCVAGSVVPSPCVSGTYQALVGHSSCSECPATFACDSSVSSFPQDCPVGHWCANGTTTGTQNPCPIGTYSSRIRLLSPHGCQPCPPGFHCSIPGLGAPQGPCNGGYLCFGAATTAAPNDNIMGVICPRAHYCPPGSLSPVPCPPGTYSASLGNAGLGDCLLIPPGRFSRLSGVLTPTKAASKLPNFGGLPPVRICANATVPSCCQNTATANTSATNTSNTTGNTTWTPSPTTGSAGDGGGGGDGSFGVPNSTSGNHSEANITFANATGVSSRRLLSQAVCPPLEQRELCVNASCDCQVLPETLDEGTCEQGFLCSGGSPDPRPIAASYGHICARGHMCPRGTLYEIPCSPGYFNPSEGQSSCLDCPRGHFCASEGSSKAENCPLGFWCPGNTVTPTPCPTGSVGILERSHNASTCQPCPRGSFCSSPGRSSPTGFCAAGFYCRSGAVVPSPLKDTTALPGGEFNTGPCPVGHYCDEGTVSPRPCPVPTFLNTTGGTGVGSCLRCTPGMYCATEGLSAPTGPCSAGFYCPGGEHMPSNSSQICPVGHRCPLGSAFPIPCPPYTYQDRVGQSSCLPCEPGTMCPSQSRPPLPCPIGYYCAANSDPALCEQPSVGLYGAGPGLPSLAACSVCPAGRYCRGGAVAGNCSAGHLCVSGNIVPDPGTFGSTANASCAPTSASLVLKAVGDFCSPGRYCLTGTPSETPCPIGTYRNLPGAAQLSACLPCPPGHLCGLGTAAPRPCPAGYYCFNNTAHACAAGLYQPLTGVFNASLCVPCVPGFWCKDTGMADTATYPCPPGYYCPLQTLQPLPCPHGTFRATIAGSREASCDPCPLAHFCRNATAVPLPCPPHHFCPVGTSVPRLCRAGTYCPGETGAPLVCPAGNFCGNASAVPLPCPAAHFCVNGSALPASCPASHYCPPQTAQPLVCPAGMYCPFGVEDPIRCVAGTYCVEGSEYPALCPLGTFATNHTTNRTSMEQGCRSCPAGTFGADFARLSCTTCNAGHVCLARATTGRPIDITGERGYICPSGHFCVAGALVPAACPPGTYNALKGRVSAEDCLGCPLDSFTNLWGRSLCNPCGNSATAPANSTRCTCKGKNRNFQKSDGTCRCQPGYRYYAAVGSDEDPLSGELDSPLDCEPIIFPRCSSQALRAPDGSCMGPVAADVYCSGACSTGYTATLDPMSLSTEVKVAVCSCTCNGEAGPCVTSEDRIAKEFSLGRDPVTGRPQLTMVSLGSDPGLNHTTSFAVSDIPGFVGDVELCVDAGTPCSFRMMAGDGSGGGFVGLYDAPDDFFAALLPAGAQGTPIARRRQSSSSAATGAPSVFGVASPLVCLKAGEGLMFRVDDEHYPQYDFQSLLNSNLNFDFGAFTLLKERIAENETITSFYFTFADPGVYMFYDAGNRQRKMAVGVVGTHVACPPAFKDTPIVAFNQKYLREFPDFRESSVVLMITPDYSLVVILICAVCAAVILALLVLWIIRRRGWGFRIANNPGYRLVGQTEDFHESMTKIGKVDLRKRTEDLDFRTHKRGEYDMDEHEGVLDLEGFNVHTLYDKLQDQTNLVTEQITTHKGEVRVFYDQVSKETRELRALLMCRGAGEGAAAAEAEGGEGSSSTNQFFFSAGGGPTASSHTFSADAAVQAVERAHEAEDEVARRKAIAFAYLRGALALEQQLLEAESLARSAFTARQSRAASAATAAVAHIWEEVTRVGAGGDSLDSSSSAPSLNVLNALHSQLRELVAHCDALSASTGAESQRRGVLPDGSGPATPAGLAILHPHTSRVLSLSDLVDDNGELLELDGVIRKDELTGVFVPADGVAGFLAESTELTITFPANVCVDPVVGLVVPMEGNLFIDRATLCPLFASEMTLTAVTNAIPYIPNVLVDRHYYPRPNAPFAYLVAPYDEKNALPESGVMFDPYSGQQVPVLGATLNPVTKRVHAVGGTMIDPVTRLLVPIRLGAMMIARSSETPMPVLSITIDPVTGLVVPVGGLVPNSDVPLVHGATAADPLCAQDVLVLCGRVCARTGSVVPTTSQQRCVADALEIGAYARLHTTLVQCRDLLSEYITLLGGGSTDNEAVSRTDVVREQLDDVVSRVWDNEHACRMVREAASEPFVRQAKRLSSFTDEFSLISETGGVRGVVRDPVSEEHYPLLVGCHMYDRVLRCSVPILDVGSRSRSRAAPASATAAANGGGEGGAEAEVIPLGGSVIDPLLGGTVPISLGGRMRDPASGQTLPITGVIFDALTDRVLPVSSAKALLPAAQGDLHPDLVKTLAGLLAKNVPVDDALGQAMCTVQISDASVQPVPPLALPVDATSTAPVEDTREADLAAELDTARDRAQQELEDRLRNNRLDAITLLRDHQNQELAAAAGDTEAQRAQLLKKHALQLAALDSALDDEADRQKAALAAALERRKERKMQRMHNRLAREKENDSSIDPGMRALAEELDQAAAAEEDALDARMDDERKHLLSQAQADLVRALIEEDGDLTDEKADRLRDRFASNCLLLEDFLDAERLRQENALAAALAERKAAKLQRESEYALRAEVLKGSDNFDERMALENAAYSDTEKAVDELWRRSREQQNKDSSSLLADFYRELEAMPLEAKERECDRIKASFERRLDAMSDLLAGEYLRSEKALVDKLALRKQRKWERMQGKLAMDREAMSSSSDEQRELLEVAASLDASMDSALADLDDLLGDRKARIAADLRTQLMGQLAKTDDAGQRDALVEEHRRRSELVEHFLDDEASRQEAVLASALAKRKAARLERLKLRQRQDATLEEGFDAQVEELEQELDEKLEQDLALVQQEADAAICAAVVEEREALVAAFLQRSPEEVAQQGDALLASYGAHLSQLEEFLDVERTKQEEALARAFLIHKNKKKERLCAQRVYEEAAQDELNNANITEDDTDYADVQEQLEVARTFEAAAELERDELHASYIASKNKTTQEVRQRFLSDMRGCRDDPNDAKSKASEIYERYQRQVAKVDDFLDLEKKRQEDALERSLAAAKEAKLIRLAQRQEKLGEVVEDAVGDSDDDEEGGGEKEKGAKLYLATLRAMGRPLEVKLDQQLRALRKDLAVRQRELVAESLARLVAELAAPNLTDAEIDAIMERHDLDLAQKTELVEREISLAMDDCQRLLGNTHALKLFKFGERAREKMGTGKQAGIVIVPPPMDKDTLLEQHQQEASRLERRLAETEASELGAFRARMDEQKAALVESEKEKLSLELEGVDDDAARARLVQKHEESVAMLVNCLDEERARQEEALQATLAQKRAKKKQKLQERHAMQLQELALTEKHQQEAEALKQQQQSEQAVIDTQIEAEKSNLWQSTVAQLQSQKEQDMADAKATLELRLNSDASISDADRERLLSEHQERVDAIERTLGEEQQKAEVQLKQKLAAKKAKKKEELERKMAMQMQAQKLTQLVEVENLSADYELDDEDDDIGSVVGMDYLNSRGSMFGDLGDMASLADFEREQQELKDQLAAKHEEERKRMEEEFSLEQQRWEEEVRQLHEKRKQEKAKAIEDKKKLLAQELAALGQDAGQDSSKILERHEAQLKEMEEQLDEERIRQDNQLKAQLAAKKEKKLRIQREKEAQRAAEAKKLEEEQAAQMAAEEEKTRNSPEKVAERPHKKLSEMAQLERVRNRVPPRHIEPTVRRIMDPRHSSELGDLKAQHTTQRALKLKEVLDASAGDEEKRASLEKEALSALQAEQALAIVGLREKQSQEIADAVASLMPSNKPAPMGRTMTLLERAGSSKELLSKSMGGTPTGTSLNPTRSLVSQSSFSRGASFGRPSGLNRQTSFSRFQGASGPESPDALKARIQRERADFMKEMKGERETFDRQQAVLRGGAVPEDGEAVAVVLESSRRRGSGGEMPAGQSKEGIFELHEQELQRLHHALDAERLRQARDVQKRLEQQQQQRTNVPTPRETGSGPSSARGGGGDWDKQTVKRRPPALNSTGAHSDGHDQKLSGEMLDALVKSPLYTKLHDIEVLLQKVLAANAPPHKAASAAEYVDAKDASYRAEGDLQPVEANTLTCAQFILLRFGEVVVDLLVSRLQWQRVYLETASRLPSQGSSSKIAASASFVGTAYCHSVYYEHGSRSLYVRLDRLNDAVGDFLVMLLHSIAHLQHPEADDSDSNPLFVGSFLRALQVSMEHLCWARVPSETSASVLLGNFGSLSSIKQKRAFVAELLHVDPKLPAGADLLRALNSRPADSSESRTSTRALPVLDQLTPDSAAADSVPLFDNDPQPLSTHAVTPVASPAGPELSTGTSPSDTSHVSPTKAPPSFNRPIPEEFSDNGSVGGGDSPTSQDLNALADQFGDSTVSGVTSFDFSQGE